MTHHDQLSPLLQSALREIEQAIAGMTDEQMDWHPEGRWSSVQLVEHLSLSYSRSAAGMRRALSDGKPETRGATMKERVGKMLLLQFAYIPPGRKGPEAIHPKGLRPKEALAAARQGLAQVDKIITECEKHFGDRTRVYVHPVLGPLTAEQWRKFHLVHTRHHMRQVREWRKRMG